MTKEEKAIVVKYLSERRKANRRQRKYVAKLGSTYSKTHRAYYLRDLAKSLWKNARARARDKNLPFTITPADIVIPETCPALGIKIFVGEGRPTGNSPSVDEVVRGLGYVPGNIAVMSFRANSIKRDATLSELIQITDFVKNFPQ